MKNNLKPAPPEHLSERARAWWDDVVNGYALEPHHVHLLRLACEALDRAEQARQLLEKDGLTVATAAGSVKEHPAAAVEREAARTFMRLVRELGINVGEARPAGRPLGDKV